MVSFEIGFDRGKCTDCGLCVRDCVSGVLEMREGGPAAVEPGWCNLCSHCLAVCPTDAVRHSGLAGRSAPRPLAREKVSAESYREIVMGRRSVRQFKDEAVSREELEDILEVASYSPTASNTLDVGYTVITDRELIKRTGRRVFEQAQKLKALVSTPWGKLLVQGYMAVTGNRNVVRYIDRLGFYEQWTAAGRDLITHHAPVLILIHAPVKGRFNDANCHIAAANLTNYAFAKGLGTCYLGLMVYALDRSKKWAAKLGTPPGRRVYQVIALGRPAFKYHNSPARPAARVDWK